MFHSLLVSLAKIIAIPLVGLLTFAGFQIQPQTFGDYNPSGGNTYRLQSSVGSTDSSIPLSSFKEPISNIPYTMSYLNSSIEYGTLEPSNTTKKEFISFSGITQNADGSATLTGVIRGLSFSYPYTASTTFQQSHSGQSIFILSNPPQLTNQYANLSNNNIFAGFQNFSNRPYATSSTATSTSQFVTLGELNAVSVTGAATSTENIMGISMLPTDTELAAGTASSSSGAPKVVPNRALTTNCVPIAGRVPVTNVLGQISANCIATSTPFVFPTITMTNATTTSLQVSGLASTSQMIVGALGVGVSTTTQRNAQIAGSLEIDGNLSVTGNTSGFMKFFATPVNSVTNSAAPSASFITVDVTSSTTPDTARFAVINVIINCTYTSTQIGSDGCGLRLRKNGGTAPPNFQMAQTVQVTTKNVTTAGFFIVPLDSTQQYQYSLQNLTGVTPSASSITIDMLGYIK